MPFSFARIFRASKNRKSSKETHPSTSLHGVPAIVAVSATSASSSCVDLPTTVDARQRRRPHTLTVPTRSHPALNQAYLNPPPYSALSTIYSATGTACATPPTSPEPSPNDQVIIIGREPHSVQFPPTPGGDSDTETLAGQAEGGSTSKLDLGQGPEEVGEEQGEEPIVQIEVRTRSQVPASEQPWPPTRQRQISFSPPQSRSASPVQDDVALPEPRRDRPATTSIAPRGILKNSPSRSSGIAACNTTIPAAPTPMSETFDFAPGTSVPNPQRSSVQARPQQLPIGPTPTQDEIDAAQSQRKRKAMSMFQFQRKMSQRDLPPPPMPPQPPSRVPGIVAKHFSVPPLTPTYRGENGNDSKSNGSTGHSRRNTVHNSNRNGSGSNAPSSAAETADEALPTYRQSVQPPNQPSKRSSNRGSRTSRWNTDWNSDETQAVLTALRALN